MNRLFDLQGLVAVVTGGNRGIGRGIAEALLRNGASVAILASDSGRNEDAVRALSATNPSSQVIAVTCDVADQQQVTDAMDSVVAQLGSLDVCFANAGVGTKPVKFVDSSLEEWHRVNRVNLDGAFLTLREAARHMVGQGGGSLVVTSSLTAVQGAARNAPYGAGKAGLLGLVRSVAVELARYGVRANALLPGWIETELTAPMLGSEAFADRVLPRVPAGRWGTPADIGAAAVFLASPDSGYVNGTTLVVDGAYSIF